MKPHKNHSKEKQAEPDRLERLEAHKLHRIHCDMIERHTHGRLTFAGDRVVRSSGDKR